MTIRFPIRCSANALVPLLLCTLLAGGGTVPATALAVEHDVALTLQLSAPAGSGSAGNELMAGQAAGATDGFDPGLDARALTVGALQAWFFHPDAPERARMLRRDVRDGAVAGQWDIQVFTPSATVGSTVATGAPVTVTWQPPVTQGGTCAAGWMTLTDPGTGESVDMAQVDTFTFPAPGPDGTYALELAMGPVGAEDGTPPAAPERLSSPQAGRRGVMLVWSPSRGAAGYHVERNDAPGDPASAYHRLTPRPITETRYLDGGTLGGGTVAYRVIAVSGSGCASAPSNAVLVTP